MNNTGFMKVSTNIKIVITAFTLAACVELGVLLFGLTLWLPVFGIFG